MKITEKVSFNIASEASYVYKLLKNALNGQFWRVLDEFRLEKSHFEDFLEFVKS